ncbi:hypothetical protein E2C01_005713 [Portunus trituberculatus]|uniref:Uncharacterized protein n=1 Tax=Portunus trituberculatus TaxID=210409 RepID=A0A5B7CV31_PORTR|nr:hypothetical protein [Portunus trituberculatus]
MRGADWSSVVAWRDRGSLGGVMLPLCGPRRDWPGLFTQDMTSTPHHSTGLPNVTSTHTAFPTTDHPFTASVWFPVVRR